MMNFYNFLLLSAILYTASARSTLTGFNKILSCPTPNATLYPSLLTSKTQCGSVCVTQTTCNIFYFEPDTNKCYLGDSCLTANQWTNGTCTAYTYSESLSDDKSSDNSSQLFQQLQMKLFYKFKTNGVVNEVNPRLFCLTAHNVTVGSDGAVFRGDNDSYMMTETSGFSQFFDYGNNYSMYMAVRLNMDQTITLLFRLQQCIQFGTASLTFAKSVSDLLSSCHKSGLTYRAAQAFGVLPMSNQTALMSAGFVFNGTSIPYFYFNGTLKSPLYGEENETSFSAQFFDCLTLGLGISVKYRPLNGTMYCFGLSTNQLQIGDLKSLENYCFN